MPLSQDRLRSVVWYVQAADHGSRDTVSGRHNHVDTITCVAALLAEHWDRTARFQAPNGACDATSHARAILAIFAGGGPPAQAIGYLRHAEEEALGAPVSTGQERGAMVDLIWAWSWDRQPLPGDPGATLADRARDAAT